MMTTKINLAIFGVAVSTPLWIDMLQTVSTIAALLFPIIGCVLGIFQLLKLLRGWNEPKT